MALAYIGLGTNLGDKELNLRKAIEHITKEIGQVAVTSSFYKFEPWGFSSINHFLNAVIIVKTPLSPIELLHKTQQIESVMGRTSKTQKEYTDRIIDIDILFFDDMIVDTMELKIPHPLLQERDFVLIPLVEIASDFIHPVLRKSILELKKDLLSVS